MGDLHFYYHKQYRNIIPFFGVNALNGATFISTNTMLSRIGTTEECQCPEWGDLHFYRLRLLLPSLKNSCVNALKGAISISTARFVCNSKHAWNCVNALKGATSISTLASGNPHK